MMNKDIFKGSTLSDRGIKELESITHYSENRLRFWGRITDIFGYILATAVVATPFIFGIVANVTGAI